VGTVKSFGRRGKVRFRRKFGLRRIGKLALSETFSSRSYNSLTDGATPNAFIVSAVAKEVSTPRTADCFAARLPSAADRPPRKRKGGRRQCVGLGRVFARQINRS
jgi:hypothetical protein